MRSDLLERALKILGRIACADLTRQFAQSLRALFFGDVLFFGWHWRLRMNVPLLKLIYPTGETITAYTNGYVDGVPEGTVIVNSYPALLHSELAQLALSYRERDKQQRDAAPKGAAISKRRLG